MQRRHFIQAGLLATAAPVAWAQPNGWPGRSVKFILSQPAGAGPDIIARYIADQLAKVWNQPVVVENRPGGQNLIGAQAAARSPADGYAFYFGTTAALVTNLYTFKTLPYDPVKDFVPVRLVGRSPFVIAAAASYSARDLGEALAAARAQPGAVAMATEGPKTFSGMLVDYVANTAGVKFNQVPYTKATDALQDVIGGRVPLICLPNAALASYIKSGQLRALAVSTMERLPDLPQVPTLAERFPGFEYTGWNGLFAPAGTPAEVIARVNRDLEAILRQPEVVQKMMSLGSIAVQSMSVAEYEGFMRKERERWAEVVKTIGIQPE